MLLRLPVVAPLVLPGLPLNLGVLGVRPPARVSLLPLLPHLGLDFGAGVRLFAGFLTTPSIFSSEEMPSDPLQRQLGALVRLLFAR